MVDKAEKPLVPVCTKMFEDEWDEFKRLTGRGQVGHRLRMLVRAEIRAQRAVVRASNRNR